MTGSNAFLPYVIIYFLELTSWNVSFYEKFATRLCVNKNKRRVLSCLKGGGKFLKKVWCCADGRVEQSNLVLSKRQRKKLLTLVSLYYQLS